MEELEVMKREGVLALIEHCQFYKNDCNLNWKQRQEQNCLYERLEEQFIPLLKGAVYHYRWLDNREDLWQVARYSFYQCVMNYQLSGDVFFEYYSKRKVYGDLRTYTRRTGRIKEREQIFGYLDDRKDTILVSERVEWSDLLANAHLIAREKEIICLLYEEGYRITEISKQLQLDPGTVRKYHRFALEKVILFWKRSMMS